MNDLTRDEFQRLFLQALHRALAAAERRTNARVPKDLLIELHANGRRDRISVQEATGILYLGPDRFYKIIDIAVIELADDTAVVFVRVSGHPPVAFDDTWNPQDFGPFKQIEAAKIKRIAGKLPR